MYELDAADAEIPRGQQVGFASAQGYQAFLSILTGPLTPLHCHHSIL